MNQQIEIEEVSTKYDITSNYHSGLMCQNYDATIIGITENDNRISIYPRDGGSFFEFSHSDPDRVIAVAQLMLSFATMVKKNNQKAIDTSSNE